MNMTRTLRLAALAVSALICASATATDRAAIARYYSGAAGLKGADLKTAIRDIIRKHNVVGYGSGQSNTTWWAFYATDRADDGTVINRYSDATFCFGNRGSAASGMNIEHSFPKSWWGGGKNDAYKDLFNLYPSPSADNSQKSNYPMALVTNVIHDSGEGYDKVGTGMVDGSVRNCWEPGDRWKGDFARSYMYMAVCYAELTWVNVGLQTLQNDEWPTLKAWAQKLYRSWSDADKVDATEASRNEAVYTIQGNRNPFVDFPFLCQYIWGDSVDVAFDPELSVTTATDDSRYADLSAPDSPGTPDPEPSPYVYYADCKSDFGSMTADVISGDLTSVWTQTANYGWKASAYAGGSAHEAEASLTTPAIALTDYSSAVLTFSHAVNFSSSPSDALTVSVICDEEETELSVPSWPSGKNWVFTESGEIDLTPFASRTVTIIFTYTSTASEAPTWEIKDVKVVGVKKNTTSVTMPQQGNFARPDLSQPYEEYTTSGARIAPGSGRGLKVIRQGGHAWMIVRK